MGLFIWSPSLHYTNKMETDAFIKHGHVLHIQRSQDQAIQNISTQTLEVNSAKLSFKIGKDNKIGVFTYDEDSASERTLPHG